MGFGVGGKKLWYLQRDNAVWGLHCMASLGMQGFGFLRVWPIQRHLLFLISSATGRWLVFSQMMSFLILSCHLTFRIFLRQLLMKVWTLRMTVSVVLQVSHPYSSTDFTFELNSLSLVLREIFPDFQMFRSCVKAVLAFPILAFTSASVPPSLSTMLPK